MAHRKEKLTPGDSPAGIPKDPGALPDRPTINDIARFAQVSKKTVSRVLNKSPFVSA
jgi:LacI family transcriptional regulator